MTLEEMKRVLGLVSLVAPDEAEKEVEGCYASDMLSWVMAHAKENQVWVTIQAHPNVVAVASLLNLAAIIVAEDVQVEKDTLVKAMQSEIAVYSSPMSIYEICGLIYTELSK